MLSVAIIVIGFAFLIAAMTFAWLLVRKTGNGGLVDVVWTFALGATALFYCVAANADTSTIHGRPLIAAGLTLLWTVRLGLPLWRRNVGGAEDARYTALRQQWGKRFMPRLFGLLMIQAVAALLLALTIMLAACNPLPLGALDALGVSIIACALCGGYVADEQLARFKKDPTKHGQICDAGLWGRSRHPNYFFEVMFWSGWPLLALSGGWLIGALAIAGPVFMYWLLRHVSGEPLVEAHMTRRYGDIFKNYCSRVSPFFPRLF
jgi:steroid 5-alpha reductase family enzyme